MREDPDALSIGRVESATGLTARQIRYYEQRGLVDPRRSSGRHRQYTRRDVERLLDIKRRLAAGESLTDLRRALDRDADPPVSGGPLYDTDAESYFRGHEWVRHGSTAGRTADLTHRHRPLEDEPRQEEE